MKSQSQAAEYRVLLIVMRNLWPAWSWHPKKICDGLVVEIGSKGALSAR